MRHDLAVPRTCHPYLFALIAVALLVVPSLAAAQAAFGVSFTRQGVSAGNRSEGLSGYNLDLSIRLAPRLALLIGGGEMGHDGNTTRDEFTLQSFRTGLQMLAVRNRAVDLSFAVGVGLHSLSLDREEDGAGTTAFVQAQLSVHPLPVVGFSVGGIAQSFSGFGNSIGGNSVGLTLGIQLRSSDW